MPAVLSGRVLVTGATGFIAAWIIQQLLEDGYHVRGTVRSEAKGASLQKIYAHFGDHFEPFIVRDMTEPGAYDDAVKGMDAIMHVASPCTLDADDPKELIDPAVSGTLGVLESTLKHGSSVRRVVVTASCATIITAQPEFKVFDENDWNDKAVETVKAHGREASPLDKYRASKVLAERAAWKFVEQHRGEVQWELATIHPPWVFGPVLGVDKPEHMNSSMTAWWKAVEGAHDNDYLATVGGEWVDVRDVALAHVLAIQKEAMAGQRVIVSAGPYKLQHWATITHSIDARLPVGDASYNAAKAVYAMRFDASKSKKLLGLEYRTMEQTAKDIISQFQEKGWIV